MWYWFLYGVLAVWVLGDGLSRKTSTILWALGTLLLGPLVLPIYLAKRPLKVGEVREGGTAWNVLKNFAILWTVLMGVVAFMSLFAIGRLTSPRSGAEQAGAALGTVLGLGLIGSFWFFPMVGALVLGLMLKKSSVIERGSASAEIANPSHEVPASAPTKWHIGVVGWIGIVFLGLIFLGGISIFLPGQGAGIRRDQHRHNTPYDSAPTSGVLPTARTPTQTPEQAYLPYVKLTNVQVTEGYGQFDMPGYSERKPAVKGTLRNTGNRTLKRVAVTVYFLNSQGQRIAEKDYAPVSKFDFTGDAGPLKPNYVRDFGYIVEDVAPSEWARAVEVEVSSIEFVQ